MGKRRARGGELAEETCGVLGSTPLRKKLNLDCIEPDGKPLSSLGDQDNAPATDDSVSSATGIMQGYALEGVASASASQKLASSADATTAAMAVDTSPSSGEPAPVYNAAKRAQVVVGVNAVTRLLERNGLRFGLVCRSARPPLVHRHLLQLAATRGVPFAALPALSVTASPLLGVKSALAVGVKVGG